MSNDALFLVRMDVAHDHDATFNEVYDREHAPNLRGVPANVVILSREGLSELIAAKRIAAETDVDLARVPLGVAVRAGSPKPDVSTVEAFKQLLLNAKSVAIPGSTSGIWLKTDLLPRLGIADKINIKVSPRGTGATGMVAVGDADLAVMPVSEIVHAPGVDLVGPIAPEIQFVQTFSAGVVAGSVPSLGTLASSGLAG